MVSLHAENRSKTHCVSWAWTLNNESNSEPAAVVAAAMLLCNLLVSAAVAAFLNASCNVTMNSELGSNAFTHSAVAASANNACIAHTKRYHINAA